MFDPQTKEKKVTVLELTLTNLATIIAEKKDCGGTLKDHKVNITVLRAATGKGVMLRTRSKGVMPLGMPVKLPPINKAPLSNQAVLALLGEQSTPEEFVSEGENNPFGD